MKVRIAGSGWSATEVVVVVVVVVVVAGVGVREIVERTVLSESLYRKWRCTRASSRWEA